MANQYDVSNEPIVISKPLMDIFFNPNSKQYANLKNPTDAISLYMFYYYTAKWQKTNQPKATTSYAAQGLKWTEEKIRKNKKVLITLNLIKNITSRDPETKAINGHYIYVNFIWSKEKAILHSKLPSGSTHSVAQTGANALSNSKKNTLSDSSLKTIINDSIGETSFAQEIIADNKNDNQEEILPVNTKSNTKNIRERLSAEKLIRHWSSLGYTTNHKEGNKTYERMIKKLIALQKGTFKNIGPFDPDWISKNKIPEKWFIQSWTYPELINALNLASRYSLDDFWPDDKTFYKSLDNILYSTPFVKKQIKPGCSWLFTAMQNPPVPNKQKFQKIHFETTVDKLIKNPMWPKDIVLDKYKLGSGLKEMNDFILKLVPDPYNRISQYFGTLNLMLKEYLQWIDENDWIEINQGIIGTNNGVFRKFIEFQSKEIGIQIKSKGWK